MFGKLFAYLGMALEIVLRILRYVESKVAWKRAEGKKIDKLDMDNPSAVTHEFDEINRK